MKCPECGAWTEVRETRGPRRRRECANGHRFSTEEVVIKSRKTKNDQKKMQLPTGKPVPLARD
jgi:transcriptional regulator NrdR family protein